MEDFFSSCCVSVRVSPHITTAALKQQVGVTDVSYNLGLRQTRKCSYVFIFRMGIFFFHTSDVSWVRLSSTSAALDNWSVLVQRSAIADLVWRPPKWWHGLPVPPVCPSCSLDAPSPATGPGERSSSQFSITSAVQHVAFFYLCPGHVIKGQEAVHHTDTQAADKHQHWWVRAWLMNVLSKKF